MRAWFFLLKKNMMNNMVEHVFFNKKIFAGVICLITAVVLFSLWQYTQNRQKISMVSVSADYNKIIKMIDEHDKKGVVQAKQFIDINPNNYGVLMALSLVKFDIDNNDYSSAENHLLWAKKIVKEENLKSLIHLRLARVQLQENKLEAAITSLDQITSPSWYALSQDIRGDVLFKKHDFSGARKAYKEALESSGSVIFQTLLKIKLNNIPS